MPHEQWAKVGQYTKRKQSNDSHKPYPLTYTYCIENYPVVTETQTINKLDAIL